MADAQDLRRLSACAFFLASTGLTACADREAPTAPESTIVAGPSATQAVGAGNCRMIGSIMGAIEVCNLGTLGGTEGQGMDINESGWVVGNSENAEGVPRATLWKYDGSVLNLSDEGFLAANGISDNGWVVGRSGTRVLRWREDLGLDVLDAPGNSPVGNAINSRGQVAGSANFGQAAIRYRPEAGTWQIWQGVGTFSGHDINNAGLMVGTVPIDFSKEEAATYDPLPSFTFTRIGLLPAEAGKPSDFSARALGVSDSPPFYIVGWSENVFGKRAFIDDPDEASLQELPPLDPNSNFNEAHDVNDLGFSVGVSRTSDRTIRAVAWTPDRQVIDLEGLFTAEDRSQARAINNRGEIVGWTRTGGQSFPTIWRLPLEAPPPPSADADGDGIEDGVDVEPNTPSTEFSDQPSGTTSGSFDPGGQTLTVSDLADPDGVLIQADPDVSPEAEPAAVTVCEGTMIMHLLPGNLVWLTCSSVDLQVVSGPVTATFIADDGTTGSASVPSEHSLIFNPGDGSFTAPASNSSVIQIAQGGLTLSLQPGSSEQLDTEPPSIGMTVDPTELWPPNHKMVRVADDVSASDNSSCLSDLTLAVASDEAADGSGDGDTEPDWIVEDNSDGTFDVWVRAERSGKGDGRTYTIEVTATDCAGNTASQVDDVSVPKSRGRGNRS